jgi:hypothetical protein
VSGAALVLLLVAFTGVSAAAPPDGAGPPPWAPGPGGPDVVHVMHGNAANGQSSTPSQLTSHGGAVQTNPAVYVVFWGNQWGSATSPGSIDPAGEAAYLQSFLGGLYGSADTWSTSTTQYCQGVASGTTNCAGAAPSNMITHPTSTPLLAPGWYDNTVSAPKKPSQSQLAAEAVRAASHFGVSASARVQIVVATAHNYNASGFGSSYCAWHSSTSYNGGYLAYTNLPYIADAGASCGAGFVATSAVPSNLQGVSIVGGHEYAEAITDPFPNNGWLDQNGAENGDKCAWIRSGPGASAVVNNANGSFTIQSLWSNSANSGAGGCVVRYVSAGNQG